MPTLDSKGDVLEDSSPCAGVRADLKTCLLQSDCVKKVWMAFKVSFCDYLSKSRAVIILISVPTEWYAQEIGTHSFFKMELFSIIFFFHRIISMFKVVIKFFLSNIFTFNDK